MDTGQMALLIPIAALMIPITAIVTSHFRHLAEIKARTASGLSEEVRAELNEIKSQIISLRDTTTKFDMTFDAALSRLEERVDRVEERQTTVGSAASGTAATVSVGRSQT